MTKEQKIYTVSQLNQEVFFLLEKNYSQVMLSGEISNFVPASSGHWYFTLKDNDAQIKVAMFKRANSSVRFKPQNGDAVLIRCHISLYRPRGDYQAIAANMRPLGEGDLNQAFEALKKQLQSEGLFDANYKKTIPYRVAHLAIITSPTGAAIQDILSVLSRRMPLLRVTLLPASVQGTEAESDICKAFEHISRLVPQPDVVLLTRGGGSLEDLWTFNLASVAYAIFNCNIPVISAVGHETDVTIADFVADVRAPTPSAGAEILISDQNLLAQRLATFTRTLQQITSASIEHRKRKLFTLSTLLKDPGRSLDEKAQALDFLTRDLHRAWKTYLQKKLFALQKCKLSSKNLNNKLNTSIQHCDLLQKRIMQIQNSYLSQKQSALNTLIRTLQATHPYQTLVRGYAILSLMPSDGDLQATRSIQSLQNSDIVKVHLSDGHILAQVQSIHEGSIFSSLLPN